MSKIDVNVSVEKEAHELGLAIQGLVLAFVAKKPLAEIFAGELASVMAGVNGVEQLPAELKEDAGAFIKAFALPVFDVVGALLAKK